MPGRRWTADDEWVVISRLTRWRVETIARHLGRTPKAVRRWMERTGQYPQTQDLVTSGVAAEVTGRSPGHLRRLARTGRVRARRVPDGRHWLFDLDELARHFPRN